MATYVLIHGMWHGGWCWKKVRALLQAAGHEVFTPTLTGCGERSHLRSFEIDLNTHAQDIVQVLEFEDLRNVILCGHSYAATVMMAVAEQAADRLAHLVSLDEDVPQDGQAFKDIYADTYLWLRELALAQGNEWWVSAPQQWQDRRIAALDEADWKWMQSKLTAFPLKTWETPLHYKNPTAAALPRTYIACTESPDPDTSIAYGKSWASEGHFRTLATMHDAMVTQPEQLSNLLLELA
jgi:pimeloyl-ACP methyl ester carboxylesterase